MALCCVEAIFFYDARDDGEVRVVDGDAISSAMGFVGCGDLVIVPRQNARSSYRWYM